MSVGKLELGAGAPRAASGDPLRALAEWLPQAALFIGAGAGALVGYNGHRLFAFAPKRTQ